MVDGNGFTLVRGTVLQAQMPKGEQTACEFRTAHDVTLWPLEIVEATLTGAPSDLPINRLPTERTVRGAVRLRLRTTGGVPLAQLALDRLTIHLAGTDEVAHRLYELLMVHACGILVTGAERPLKWQHFLPSSAMVAEGFDESQALFPYATRSFQGYRLLHEYFAFPARYMFWSLTGLKAALQGAPGDTVDIVVLLDRGAHDLERIVDEKQFALFCAPAVNLFPRRSDRLPVMPDQFEHHVVMDRARPLDFELYTILKVEGHTASESDALEFRPFYGSLATESRQSGRYYSQRREPRLLSERARRQGPRTGYIGSEVFLSLVDQEEAPYRGDLRQLTVLALCTNRDLPLLMPMGGPTDFTLIASAPVEAIKVLRGPSRPTPALADREITWRLISHLGLNYLTLTELDREQGAVSLRRLLGLYTGLADPQTARQIDGVQGLALRPVTRRMPRPGPLVFGRGVELTLTFDEDAFAGTGAFLLGLVLERFFARHVSLNSFTETVVRSVQRGEIARWTPRSGERPVA
jgi:type VI secretion system protein ImpG